MREFMKIVESMSDWPQTIDGNSLARKIEADGIHHSPEDFDEGDLFHNITSFGRYELKRIPVAGLKLGMYTIHDDLVDDYAALIAASQPPIVINPIHNLIIDGNHRANAAAKRGDHEILAYVGDPSTYSPPDDEDDDGEWHPELYEAEHSDPSWQYDQGGSPYGNTTTARVVKGSFKVKDEKSVTGEWPYGYSFIFARTGEVEISFYLDAMNYFGSHIFQAAEEGKISHEKAKELQIRQLSDGMGMYNMMGANVARTVLRVMGTLVERFVAEYDPPVLMMVAKTDRRMTVYERMLRQLPGYQISHEPDPRGTGHIVYARKSDA